MSNGDVSVPGFGQLPVTVRVANGAGCADGVHVLACIDAPQILRHTAYLALDMQAGQVLLCNQEGQAAHVALADLILKLARAEGAADPAASRLN